MEHKYLQAMDIALELGLNWNEDVREEVVIALEQGNTPEQAISTLSEAAYAIEETA